MSSFVEKHLQEASTPEIESAVEVSSPKKNKHDESDDEEENETHKPSPKRKEQLDTCE